MRPNNIFSKKFEVIMSTVDPLSKIQNIEPSLWICQPTEKTASSTKPPIPEPDPQEINSATQIDTVVMSLPKPPPPPPPLPLRNTIEGITSLEARHMQIELRRLKRNCNARLSLQEIVKEGSLLSTSALEKLQTDMIRLEDIRDFFWSVKIFSETPSEIDDRIRELNGRIKNIQYNINCSKMYQFRCTSLSDFTTYFDKLTTEELKLVWGCYQKTQFNSLDPLIAFYETYPDEDMKRICDNNQLIYQSLFDNCASFFVKAFKQLIEERERGIKKSPVYVVTPFAYPNPKAASSHLFRRDVQVTEQEFLDSLKKRVQIQGDLLRAAGYDISQPTSSTNLISSTIRAAISQEKELVLKINYMLEKFEQLALATAQTFNLNLLDLMNQKKYLEDHSEQQTEMEGDSLSTQEQLVQVEEAIKKIQEIKRLAQDYLTHPFFLASNLQGAREHDFVKNFRANDKTAEQIAEEYANNQINIIRNR